MRNEEFNCYENELSASRVITGSKATQIESFLSDDSKQKIAEKWYKTQSELHHFQIADESKIEEKAELSTEELIHSLELDASIESYARAVNFTTAHNIIMEQALQIEKMKRELEKAEKTAERKTKQYNKLAEKIKDNKTDTL